MLTPDHLRPARLLATAALLLWAAATAAHAQTIITPQNERRVFSDAQILDGFLKTAFGAEYRLAGRSDGIRKYDKPVRIFIDNRARPDRRKMLAAIIADIARKVHNLDLAQTDDRATATMIVTLVRDRALDRAIAAAYGKERAREIKRTMDPQCLSSFTKDETLAIINSNVILTADISTPAFKDCAYEEILQALGPINDTDSVPWTAFNDDVSASHFTLYDQYLLNILYHPRIRPGMSVDAVKAIVPDILPEVRGWVAMHN